MEMIADIYIAPSDALAEGSMHLPRRRPCRWSALGPGKPSLPRNRSRHLLRICPIAVTNRMLDLGLRHLPVVEGGRVVGMVSATDLLVLVAWPAGPQRDRVAVPA